MALLPFLASTPRVLLAAATIAGAAALAPAGGPHPAAAAGQDRVELVMVEQPGCEWCARWNAEIAPAYPNTDEGRFAPLRRVQLRALPDDLGVDRRVTYTPTFLIVVDGQEIARLEGYPGEDFFWPVLAKLLSDHAGFAATPTSRTNSTNGGENG